MNPHTVLIASYLEPEHVARVRAVDPSLHVIYEPDLLRPPRYAADHHGAARQRTPEEEARWQGYLAQAEILFDFDHTHHEDLPELAPNLRWIQATSAGIGQFVRRMGYGERMPGCLFTTASGVHARPLAEFSLMAMMMHVRNFWLMQAQQSQRHWERLAGTDLDGRTVAIVGMGKIGTEVARLARPFGMTVLGSKRSPQGLDPADLWLDELHGPEGLAAILPRAEFLVLATPHTDETEALIGPAELDLLPDGAMLINIARGAVVDEAALIAALRSGKLAAAALDVFEEEPLPPDSPLWTMPNVIVSPHSASTSDRENSRITDIFCENLRRYLAGQELTNVLNVTRLY